MSITIQAATPADAPFIGEAITMAIGDELTEHIAGKNHMREDVINLFTTTARRTDSQYSYKNSLVAVDADGTVAGVVVSYDGARLRELRKAFFEEAERALGWKIKGDIPNEAEPREIYLDSLAVFPPYRGRGIARELIKTVCRNAAPTGKPVGLLVSKDNSRARSLYESVGFVCVGDKPFAGEVMDHMICLPHKMRPMRKASREKSAEWAGEVFDKAPYVTVSMARPDGMPYGLPLSLVRKGEWVFYFHCADEGEKIDCLREHPIVSLSAVSKCSPRFEDDSHNFTEHYNSAIGLGYASFVADRAEKIEALRLICRRFLPSYMDYFDEAIERSLDRTTIVRITLLEPPVGKAKS